jgi:hypothetical protein
VAVTDEATVPVEGPAAEPVEIDLGSE